MTALPSAEGAQQAHQQAQVDALAEALAQAGPALLAQAADQLARHSASYAELDTWQAVAAAAHQHPPVAAPSLDGTLEFRCLLRAAGPGGRMRTVTVRRSGRALDPAPTVSTLLREMASHPCAEDWQSNLLVASVYHVTPGTRRWLRNLWAPGAEGAAVG